MNHDDLLLKNVAMLKWLLLPLGGISESSHKGRHRNSPQYDDKNMLGNIGDLFVKRRRQVTKAICTICWGYQITM